LWIKHSTSVDVVTTLKENRDDDCGVLEAELDGVRGEFDDDGVIASGYPPEELGRGTGGAELRGARLIPARTYC
jgi:hypothetical protein